MYILSHFIYLFYMFLYLSRGTNIYFIASVTYFIVQIGPDLAISHSCSSFRTLSTCLITVVFFFKKALVYFLECLAYAPSASVLESAIFPSGFLFLLSRMTAEIQIWVCGVYCFQGIVASSPQLRPEMHACIPACVYIHLYDISVCQSNGPSKTCTW